MEIDTYANNSNTVAGLLALVVVALILGAMLVLQRSRGLNFKRKYYPWMAGFAIIMLVVVMLVGGLSPLYLLLGIGALIFLAVNDLTTAKVCPTCGKSYHPSRGFSPRDMKFCPSCGAPVENLQN